MKKILLAMIFTVMVAFSGTKAHAVTFGANAGLYIPQGSYAEMFDLGYYVGAYATQKIFPLTSIVARYQYTGADKSPYQLVGHSGELLLKVEPPVPFINLYAAAGGGYYHNTISALSVDYTQAGFGGVVEAGVGVSILIVDITLHGTYRYQDLKGDLGGYKGNNFGVGLSVNVAIPLTE